MSKRTRRNVAPAATLHTHATLQGRRVCSSETGDALDLDARDFHGAAVPCPVCTGKLVARRALVEHLDAMASLGFPADGLRRAFHLGDTAEMANGIERQVASLANVVAMNAGSVRIATVAAEATSRLEAFRTGWAAL